LQVKEERVKNRFTDQVEVPWHIYCGSSISPSSVRH
jgi:hypothetical protein